ncbi:hypothetical protein, partial [Escherichia coli]|uniref:hypothetical protein n=1 Tax=Escherichia coli TaxID=562 RepID=UPI00110263DB
MIMLTSPVARDPALHGLHRHDHHVVLIHGAHAGPARRQRADDLAREVARVSEICWGVEDVEVARPQAGSTAALAQEGRDR